MTNELRSFLQIILETIITFLVLLFYTRLLGKKQMSHLTFFNYITGITIGSIAANKEALKSLRLNADDVTMLLREQDIFDLSEIDYAILEPHERLSVLKKNTFKEEHQ